MSDKIVCTKEHAHYKLLPSSIKNKDSSWDFFQKVNARQWDFEFFKIHQNVVSKTQKNLNTLNHEYKNCLQHIIQKNLVPSTLLDYIKELKNKTCVKGKQNLNKEDATLSVVSSGTTIFNNINNGQEQINNIHIRKRRKLRPNKNKSASEEVHDDRSLVSNDDDDSNSWLPDGSDEGQNLSSSEKTDQDDSFDSVDHHPKAVNYYDYLVGDGQEQWSFSTEAAPTLRHQELNITKLLQEYREDSVVAAKRLINISDCRVLSLSFIFPFSNQNLQQSFTQSYKQHHHIIKDYIKPLILQPVPDDIVLWCNCLDNSNNLNDDSQLNQTMKDMKGEFASNISEAEDIHFSIIQRIVKEIRSWNSKNTEDDFMVYLYFFIDEIFSVSRSPFINIHKTMKRLSVESSYKPDVKLSYEYKKDQELDLCVIEVKKKSTTYTPNNSDFTKIHLEMKSMITKLIKMNVDNPVVYGVLVQGFDCQVYKMTLDGDGFYFSPVIHFIHLPRDVSDIMIVPKVTSCFITLKDELDQLVGRIQNKKKGKSTLLPWTRPSYKMPVLIKDPLQHLVDNN